MGIRKTTVEKIKSMHENGYGYSEIAQTFGIEESLVRTICHE